MCNAWNHSPECDCGFGGDTSLYQTYSWQGLDDFCRPTTCPVCRGSVFFLRHNGGSVWLDDLGWPWPKHACFDQPTASARIPASRTFLPRSVEISKDWPTRGLALVKDVLIDVEGRARVVLITTNGTEHTHYPSLPVPSYQLMGQLVVISEEARTIRWTRLDQTEALRDRPLETPRSPTKVMSVGKCYNHPTFGIGRLLAIEGDRLSFEFLQHGRRALLRHAVQLQEIDCPAVDFGNGAA